MLFHWSVGSNHPGSAMCCLHAASLRVMPRPGFSGTASVVTGPLGSLTLTNPSPSSLVISGGTAFASPTVDGNVGSFDLFPPTPTSWTLTDTMHDQKVVVSVIDNTPRASSITITQISTGNSLASGTVDQSGTGTITYSDGSIEAITNWTLAAFAG